jgi:taurine transport system ATP-binding protein
LIEGVSITFELPGGGSVEALKDINLSLAEGELVAVLGLRAAARPRC